MTFSNFSIRPKLYRGTGLLLASLLSGCIAPHAMDISVMSYDRVTTDLLSQQLLLNIARAKHHQPIHFTAVSNIAATFDFQVNAGAGPAATGEAGGLLVPTFGGSASENPTITIVPIEGEEFTKRLLSPVTESMVALLLRQGADVDLILRMTAGEFRTRGVNQDDLHNRPNHPGYADFRRIVLHLSSIQDRNSLYVEPLRYEQTWEFPKNDITPENLAELEKEYDVEWNPRRQVYSVSKMVDGRIVMTNYDPETLPNDEKIRLNERAEASPDNELNVDIRPGYPGGEMPFHGELRLRSLASIITFLGRGIADEPEFSVDKDPRTPSVTENPIHTMEVVESQDSIDNADIDVEFRDMHYALRPEQGYQWNREAFMLLHQMFQMTITELPRTGIPSLTIAK
jgi:hypothetical protein